MSQTASTITTFSILFITLGMIRNKVNPLTVKYFHYKKKQQSMDILQV